MDGPVSNFAFKFNFRRYTEGVALQASLEAALKMLAEPEYKTSVEKVFVIGGAQVYAEALASPQCEAVHLTEVAAGPYNHNRSRFSSTGSCLVRETTGNPPPPPNIPRRCLREAETGTVVRPWVWAAAGAPFTCDAFMPPIDAAKYRLYAAAPVVHDKGGVKAGPTSSCLPAIQYT